MLCNRDRLTDLYIEVLTQRLGVPAERCQNGDVEFDVDGTYYFVRNFAPHDPEFLVLSLGFGIDAATASPQTLHSIANAVNTKASGAHAVIVGSGVLFTCEMFAAPSDCMPTATHLAAILPRCVSALALTAGRFFDHLELAGIEAASAG